MYGKASLVLAVAVASVLSLPTPGTTTTFRKVIRDTAKDVIGSNILRVRRIRVLRLEGDPESPLAVKIPAGKSTSNVCGLVRGQFKCWEATHLECPNDVILVNSSQDTYLCDVTCTGGVDADGNCECSIHYDTCTPTR